MKIGIITLGFHYNYGGILQAYAMQSVLGALGHNAYVIGYDCRPEWRVRLGNIKWKLSKKIKECVAVTDKTTTFPLYHIPMRYFQNCNGIKETDFDAFVVGSDQVWRKEFISDFSLPFLLFAKGWAVKRIAYAPSFGTSEWNFDKESTDLIRESLSVFDGLSIREQSGADLCKKYLGLDAKVVLDPTLIPPLAAYTKFLKKKNDFSSEPFVYFVKRNLAAMGIDGVMESLGEKTYCQIYLPYEGYDCGVLPSVEDWLNDIYHAKFVFTDSFHACVFSIIFHKPFLVMPNIWGSCTRFDSLLKPLGLENRIISRDSKKIKDLLWQPVDWENVETKLNILRQDSLSFIKQALQF